MMDHEKLPKITDMDILCQVAAMLRDTSRRRTEPKPEPLKEVKEGQLPLEGGWEGL